MLKLPETKICSVIVILHLPLLSLARKFTLCDPKLTDAVLKLEIKI